MKALKYLKLTESQLQLLKDLIVLELEAQDHIDGAETTILKLEELQDRLETAE